MGLSTDFKGDDLFTLRGTYRRWVNSLGGEWLTTAQIGNVLGLSTELYRPLALDRSFFVAPRLGIGESPLSVFRDGTRMARYDLLRTGLGLDLGSTFWGGNAELRVGVVLGSATPMRDTGLPEIPEQGNNESGLRAVLRYDTLDNLFLPRRGNRVVLNLRSRQPALGADLDYHRGLAQWTGAWTSGANTLVGRAEAGSAFGAEMPY